MNIFHQIKQKKAPEILDVIIEIQKGDFNKYELDKDLGILRLDRVLYGPAFFPIDYADVPGTWNEGDNDPLDAVVFSTKPIHPGAVVEVKVVGMMKMIDGGEEDSKIITVVNVDPRFKHINDIGDFTEWQLKDVETFFKTYKYAQKGPDAVQINGFVGKEEAYKVIKDSIACYDKKFA